MKTKWSYFKWTPTDWLSSRGVRMMDATQRGWYVQLLNEAWESEPQNRLPDNAAFLQRLAGANVSDPDLERRWNEVMAMFPIGSDGLRHNPRLERELDECNRVSTQNSKAGKASASKRSQATPVQRSLISGSTETQREVNGKATNQNQNQNQKYLPGFALFWESYPKKVDKVKAEKAWRKQGCESSPNDIIAALERHKASSQWRKDNGQFIPNPATWLNGQRWEDQTINNEPTSKIGVFNTTGEIDPNS